MRSRGLQEVAGRLARALAGDDVVAALLDHVPTAVGAEAAAVVIRTDAGRLERLTPDPDAEPVEIPQTPGGVIDRVLTEQEPAWLQSPLGWRGDDDRRPARRRRLGDGGGAARRPRSGSASSRSPTGGCTPSWRRSAPCSRRSACWRRGPSPAAGATTPSTAPRSPSSAPRCPPASPRSTELTIAARYRAGAAQADVGGDWYDVLLLDDDHVALLVGDVVGHGMDAAVAMGRLRTGFHMIAPLRPDPSDMVQAVSQQVEAIPNAMCSTVLCAVIELLHRDDGLVPRRPRPPVARPRRQGPPARGGGRAAARRGARDRRRPCTTSRWSPATWSCSTPTV